jgi:hypothetical protein
MAAVITPGHHAVIYVSGADAGTSFTTEATTKDATGKIYTIDAAAKSVWHPTTTITQHWSAGPTGTITVSRLTGQLISTADEAAHTVTVDGKFLEMQPVLYCKDFSMAAGPKLTDITPFNRNYQSMTRGLSDISGTLSNFYDPVEVAAFTPAIPVYFNTKMLADTTIALKLYVHATLSLLAWAVLDSEDLKAAIDGVLDQTISWSGAKDAEGHVFSVI